MISFRDRTVIVAGGAGGIGSAVVRRFCEAGAHVIVGDVDSGRGEALAADVGPLCRFLPLDVTVEDDWRAALTLTEGDGRPVSALVNCAGIIEYVGIQEEDPARFRQIIDVNLFGVWLGMHVLSPSLRTADGGVIVNFSSSQGLVAGGYMGAYVASKWGVRGLTKTAAIEFARDGVRVCSIHPGPTRTPMTAHVTDAQLRSQPIGRFGEPAELAALVWFVASEATYSTGSEFVADGGAILERPPATD